ncbi:hypothetical protein MKEN_00862800 [Mycena kentingensis (nom. inval.)]|nr:hypothetical protein MKEN_00862800 [Mycena kentingensis (nom. inval.)]
MGDSNLPFILSRWAAAQNRNFHVFSLHQQPRAIMAGGWDLNRHRISTATFFRWLDLSEGHPITIAIGLRRINVVRVDVLRYAVGSCSGPFIPRDSGKLLEPGFYGVFLAESREPFPWPFGMNSKRGMKFQDLDEFYASYRSPPCLPGVDSLLRDTENRIPSALAALAVARDGSKCCMTGRSDLPTTVTWVFPPLAGYNLSQIDVVVYEDYRVLENLMTICTTLVAPFHQNSFSVDYEDSQRVVTFADLPNDVEEHIAANPGAERFWRLSFAHSLKVHFPGGDPAPDFKGYNVEAWMEELRASGPQLDDPKWQTPFGREVLEVHFERQMAVEEDWDWRVRDSDERKRKRRVVPPTAASDDTGSESESA